jgi:tRNA (mo5U34)-methyltransferase
MINSNDRIPPVPAGFDFERLARRCTCWHQRWQVFKGVYTPGINPIEEMLDHLQLPLDLTGKRVLDIGSWNGCASFECERRGASEVLAIGPENPHFSGFNLLHDLIGSTRTRYEHGTCYQLDPERIGKFDIVLFCGVLYHLRYPLLGLDNARRVCRGEIYVETHVSDPDLNQAVGPSASSLPLWQFYRGDELLHDESNWFGPTACAVVQALESSGFAVEHAASWRPGRAALRASVKLGLPEFLTMKTGEGAYYDEILEPLCGPKLAWHVAPDQLSLFGRATPAYRFDAQPFVEHLKAPPAAPPLWTRARAKLGRWLKAA